MMVWFLELCNDVISISPDIRFAGIIDARGKLVAHQYNTKINPLLSEDSELETMLVRSAIIEGVGKASEYKLGDPIFTIRKFANVTLITLPLSSREGYRMCISTEPSGSFIDIIKRLQDILEKKK
jgi:hypothetical protein